MALLPVGGGDLALPRLAQRPAGERLELAAHQRPPEEGAAREAGGGGVQAVAELTIRQLHQFSNEQGEWKDM